ncbi:MAG TPA: elongation factor G [Firmicutes bacterium]|nr:MAG: elongation factor G [Peptococcaceae bacterium 1109]HHT72582.1 elongation factor G [Bacillota bacterium]
MKNYGAQFLRNVALMSHGGAGKTSLAEAMLFTVKATSRLGRVDDGTSILDYDPEEVRRQITINTAIAPIEWNNHKINVLDTPGYFDFVGEVIAAGRVADSALIVVCASSGVEVGTEKAWEYADAAELPRMIFINKMDRENADFDKVVDQLREFFGPKVVPVQLPMGNAQDFSGIIDLVKGKAFGKDGKEMAIPGDLQDAVDAARDALMEAVSVADDELMMKYLEGEPLTDEEIGEALRLGTKSGDVVPVFCGSAAQGAGINLLLDHIVSCAPSPVERKAEGTLKGEAITVNTDDAALCAQVFKTMADPYVGKLTLFRVFSGTIKSDSTVFNTRSGKDERIGQLFVIKGKEQIAVTQIGPGDIGAVAKLQDTNTNDTLATKDRPVQLKPIDFPAPSMTMAAAPKAKGDEDKISSGLTRLAEEDPTFKVEKSSETGQTLISGMGDLHLEVMCSRLKSKFGADVELTNPIVPYREAIRGKAKVEGKHKKQSGGRGQYGHVWLELAPADPDQEERLRFVDAIFGGAVPRQYIPAVEKGLLEIIDEGVLAGYPVEKIKVTLLDGSYHAVDSSEMAFKIATHLAFKKGFMEANPILLEPIMNVEVRVPEAFMGDVMGDMNKKRGRIMGMEPAGQMQVIKAQAPMAEMFRYAIDLRSMTQGRGSFTMEFSHYEEVPAQIAEHIIAESKKED